MVTATLDELEADRPMLEVTNVGRETAVDVRFIIEGRPERLVGTLAPGAVERIPVSAVPYGPFTCSWTCRDERGRRHRWSSR